MIRCIAGTRRDSRDEVPVLCLEVWWEADGGKKLISPMRQSMVYPIDDLVGDAFCFAFRIENVFGHGPCDDRQSMGSLVISLETPLVSTGKQNHDLN